MLKRSNWTLNLKNNFYFIFLLNRTFLSARFFISKVLIYFNRNYEKKIFDCLKLNESRVLYINTLVMAIMMANAFCSKVIYALIWIIIIWHKTFTITIQLWPWHCHYILDYFAQWLIEKPLLLFSTFSCNYVNFKFFIFINFAFYQNCFFVNCKTHKNVENKWFFCLRPLN